MKLPRDISGADLEKALRRSFGYVYSRQVGSHRRLVTTIGREHHLTVPMHNPIKPGTLRHLLGEVATHHNLSVQEILERLEL